jgi:hypothetical protein
MHLDTDFSLGSSSSIVGEHATLLSGTEKEELTRVKNHYDVPTLTIRNLLKTKASDFELKRNSAVHFRTRTRII